MHPAMLKYIGVISMGLFSPFKGADTSDNKAQHTSQLKAVRAAKPKLYGMGIGKQEFLYNTVVSVRSLYDEIGLRYGYSESDGSTWNMWRLYLTELAPNFSNK
jgi:enterochelin esterase family protein